MDNKTKKTLLIVSLVIIYLTADILMDIFLFPMLSESLKDHHKEMVDKNMIFFYLFPVWIIGCIIFEKLKFKLGLIISGSALIATIFFAFLALPFIWAANTFPILVSTFIFCHDYGLYIYFIIAISIFGYKYFKKHNDE